MVHDKLMIVTLKKILKDALFTQKVSCVVIIIIQKNLIERGFSVHCLSGCDHKVFMCVQAEYCGEM